MKFFIWTFLVKLLKKIVATIYNFLKKV